MAYKKTRVRNKSKNNVASMRQFCNEISSADDIYLTKTKVAVRKVKSDRNGRIYSDTTKYYPKTRKNLSCAGKVFGHIRNGR